MLAKKIIKCHKMELVNYGLQLKVVKFVPVLILNVRLSIPPTGKLAYTLNKVTSVLKERNRYGVKGT